MFGMYGFVSILFMGFILTFPFMTAFWDFELFVVFIEVLSFLKTFIRMSV